VADFSIFEMYPLEGEKERKRVERERIGLSSVQTGHSGAAFDMVYDVVMT
jgi:hypothetical protein